MSKDKWGFGKGAGREGWETFEEVTIPQKGGTVYELAFGEHPHSRQDDTIYARMHGETDGRGVLAFQGIRHPLRIEIQEDNYFKESGLSGDKIRGSCRGKVWAPAGLILIEEGRGAADVLLRIAVKIPALFERTPALWRAQDRKLEGRKVYYRDHPATVKAFLEDQLCVILAPFGGRFPPADHEREDSGEPSDPFGDGSVKEDVYSDRIWWWREKSASREELRKGARPAKPKGRRKQ